METINSTPTLSEIPNTSIIDDTSNKNRFEISKVSNEPLPTNESKSSSPILTQNGTSNSQYLNVTNLKKQSSNSSLYSNSPSIRKNIKFSDTNSTIPQFDGSNRLSLTTNIKRENSFTKSILKNSDTETKGHSDSDFDFDDTKPLSGASNHTSKETNNKYYRMQPTNNNNSQSNQSSITSENSNGKNKFYIKYNPESTYETQRLTYESQKPLKLTSLFMNKQLSKDDLNGTLSNANENDELLSQKNSKDLYIHDKTDYIQEDEEKQQKPLKKSFKLKYNEENKTIECTLQNNLIPQFKELSFYKALLVEFFATAILLMFVSSVGLPIDDPTHIDSPASINGCLGSGLFVSTLIWGFGHISGVNINPAVTIALLITGETNILRALAYIGAQLAGATFGSYLIKELVPDHIKIIESSSSRLTRSLVNETTTTLAIDKPVYTSLPIGLTLVDDNITPIQGFGIETLATFILMLTVFACLDTKRTDLNGSFPLTIGFAVTICGLFAGPFTGGSMNPARSFGPAMVMGNWENHWVYWAGPISGAILAAFVYKLLVFNTKNRAYVPIELKKKDIEMQNLY